MESRKLEVVPQDFLLGFKSCVSTSRCLFAERLVHKVKKKERRKQKEEGKKRMQISRLLLSSSLQVHLKRRILLASQCDVS